jgi:hypothetical protein
MEQQVCERSGGNKVARNESAGIRTVRIQDLHHQDAVANGERTRAARIVDEDSGRAVRTNRRAVDNQNVRKRCGAALVEHGVELE